MIKRNCIYSILTLMTLFILNTTGVATATSPEGKYLVGYIEGGPFWAFPKIIDATKVALAEMGWADKIEFPDNVHFSPGWDKADNSRLIESAKKLMANADLDLIISAGTPATQVILMENNGTTPIISIGVSDPVKSKFVLTNDDSGIDNYTARVVPGRFERMFSIFHDVVGYKKLGLMYTDTDNGRKYTNLEDARKVAKERGFSIVEYTKVGQHDKADVCIEGLKWLVEQGVDAFFIPALNCFDWTQSDAGSLIAYLTQNKIPTFAREGSKYVKSGALMGFSSIDWGQRGEYTANKIIKIFQGESPRSLKMIDSGIPKISLNISVAERIGFDPPFDILAASDEIYQEVTLPEDRMIK
jgi:ABC-type uncharacterized transport system substrate-binding protein